MNAQEASDLTIQIKTSTHDLAKLVKLARDGEAWKALEFESFDAWISESFGWHRSRAYQLINIAILDEELHSTVQLPEIWTVSDRQTRKIIQIGVTDFLEQLQDAASESPEENTKLINLLISRLAIRETTTDSSVARPPQTITQSTPSSITNGQRNSRTALVMANSLEQQTKLFPAAQNIAPSVRAQVVTTLQQAAADAQGRLDAFDEAVNQRIQDRAVNAD